MSDLIARLESITFQYDEEVITTLRSQAKEIERLNGQIKASHIFHDGHEAQMSELAHENERLRGLLRIAWNDGALPESARAALNGDGDEY